jgi:elongation factor Ts
MAITTDQIKELRELTSAGILDCRKALEVSGGDMKKAVDYLTEKGLAKAQKRSERVASEGVLELYSHGKGRVGVMVEVNCETDFVARSENFRNFAHETALQIAATSPKYVKVEDVPAGILDAERQKAREAALAEGKPEKVVERIIEGKINKYLDDNVLLRQMYIRDDEMPFEKLLHQSIASLGENVIIRRFVRWETGETSAAEAES